MSNKDDNYSFVQKVWIVIGIALLAVVLLLLLKAIFSVLLLVLAGALIALFFHGFRGLVKRKTRWSYTASMTAACLITFLFVAGLVWLMGAKVQAQVAELSETLPKTIEKTKASLESSALGKKIVETATSSESADKAKALAESLFRTSFGILGDVYVILFLGIFFTVSPKLYADGFVKLMPPPARQTTSGILKQIGTNLQKWLKGKLFAMLVVFILTAIGLAIMGIPLWLTLAIIAGLLNFIPNFGPIIAMIPAVLIGFLQGPTTALLVAGLYIFVQVLESNFITPSVQKKLIKIPPALIIITQLIMGVLTGGWGLVLATPLVAILMVVIEKTYLKEN